MPLGFLADEYRKLFAGLGQEEFVFADESGLPPDDRDVRKALTLAAKSAGLHFLGFGFHSLRRAVLTRAQTHGGASSIEAQKIAGHADPRTTAGYTRLAPDERRSEILGAIVKPGKAN